MCNKKCFEWFSLSVESKQVVFALVDRIGFPAICVRYMYLHIALSFHWLTGFSASSRAINLILVYDTQ